VVICGQRIIWHGGQDSQTAKGVKLAGSRDLRDRRTHCKGLKFPLAIRNLLSIVLWPFWNRSTQGPKLRGHLWAAELGWGMDPRPG